MHKDTYLFVTPTFIRKYAGDLDSINTVKVTAKARAPHGPEIDGMRELKEFLIKHRKDDIIQNVIRRLLTYGVGRELTHLDRFAVEKLTQQAKASQYQLRDIIVDICQSETFRNTGKKED